jgi:hypothetical protein
MLKQKEMALLMAFYFQTNQYNRINNSISMKKYRNAYYEATCIMIRQFCMRKEIEE